MTTLEGVALSPGIARGLATTVRPTRVALSAPPPDGRSPLEQFRSARSAAEADLRRTLAALDRTQAAAYEILRAHIALLADPLLATEVESRLIQDGCTASAALEQVTEMLVSRFEALADPVMRQRAADLRDVCECIGRHLTGDGRIVGETSEPRVVCAADLSPAQVLQLAQANPLAFVLEQGAETSHAAILMRALAVPVVIGVPDATTLVKDGDLVLVDGDRGRVIVRPDREASMRANDPAAVVDSGSDLQPAVTSDGIAIAVTAIIADAADARRAIAAGADGIGLFRTETLFLRSEQLPSEDAQFAFYSEVVGAVGSRRVTVRLLDLGADKQSPALRLPQESNPALGLRGVRLLLARPDLLMPHLRAVIRAAAGGSVRLLVPMVVDAADVAHIRDRINEASRALGAEAPAIDVGAMVETPAAALMAEELMSAVDFMSIGTNDLAQYVLAAERDGAHMAPYYQPLHPAVLRLIRAAVRAAMRRDISISVCGEAASDPRAVPLFVGMGITELSVRASAVTRVKAQVRCIARAAAYAFAEEVVALPTALDVAARIDAATKPEIGIDVREACNSR